MLRKAIRHFWIVGVLLLNPSFLGAGANTWTGGGVPATPGGGFGGLISTSPLAPDVVYASFGNILHRSADGGRTWAPVREFDSIYAVLVHPASPSTIFVSAYVGGRPGLHVSRDGGQSWTQSLADYLPTALAGSPTDHSLVFFGRFGTISKSTDGGQTWHTAADVAGVVANLVIHPRQESIVYAASEGFEYFGDYPGSLGKSMDGGATWAESGPQPLDSAYAVAVDAAAGTTVYVATGPYTYGTGRNLLPDVQRSEDGGANWTSAREGLPASVVIRGLVADPHVSGTLYAGTDAGL